MKKIIDVENTDTVFEAIWTADFFEVKESDLGLTLRYNGIFRLLANPKITLLKLNEKQIEIIVSSSTLLLFTAIISTIFFWAIGIYAIFVNKLNIPVIIFVFLLPLPMWILDRLFNKQIMKNIIDDIKKFCN